MVTAAFVATAVMAATLGPVPTPAAASVQKFPDAGVASSMYIWCPASKVPSSGHADTPKFAYRLCGQKAW